MKQHLEQQEIRGITIKQAITYIAAVIGFVVSLVVRDINRTNQIETLTMRIEALDAKVIAGEKEREKIKTEANSQDRRLMRIETKLEK